MKTRKVLALLLAALLIVGLGACSSEPANTTPDTTEPQTSDTNETPDTSETQTPDTTETQTPDETETQTPDTSETEAKHYNIDICQLVQHDALDAATQGFIDTLTEKLGAENVTFENQNAQGDPNTCSTIINGFVSSEVDLIMANATAALQAAVAGTNTIPVLGTSITDYATALEIENWTGTVGGNVSGTSDLAPLASQAAMIQELFPDAETVGLLYCSAEANSLYQVGVVKAELEKLGYTCQEFGFSDSNDVASVTQNACDACDVIYIPTDNTAASNTELIANVTMPAGTPVVCGEAGLCKGCGVATLSISYYDLGVATGEMAYEILVNGADISTMPVQFAASSTKQYNEANCTALGITPPADYTPLA